MRVKPKHGLTVHADPPNLVSSALFLAVLGLFGIATFVDMLEGPGTPREEVDTPTPSPPTSLAALKAYPSDAKAYLRSRYFGKQTFVNLNGLVKFDVFGRSPYPDVLLGRDGFLFLGRDEALRSIQALEEMTPERADGWRKYFSTVQTFAHEVGIPYLAMFAPDKGQVYPEALPGWLRASRSPKRYVDALRGVAAEKLDRAPVDLLAVLGDLREQRPEWRLFHRLDTHWTEVAGAAAVDATLGPEGWLEGVPPFEVIENQLSPGGDLARMIGFEDRLDEVVPKVVRAPKLTCYRPNGEVMELVTKDPVQVDGYRCENPDAPRGTLLFIGRSFSVGAMVRLTQIFKVVDVRWQSWFEFARVEQIQPELIIQMFVERRVGMVSGPELLEPEGGDW